MKKHKKKSNAKKNREKRKEASRKANIALLDTSFQVERLKYEEDVAEQLNKLSADHEIYSSYFVLYEFKIGLIHSLIQFYYLVQLYEDPSKALMKLSDKIGREPKNQLIIQGLLQRVVKSINAQDIEKYLRDVEFLILYCKEIFLSSLQGLVGNFAGDEIVKYKIETNEDYEGFIELYKKRPTIPLDVFWNANIEKLKAILQSAPLKKDYPEMFNKLEEILVDTLKANKFHVNKKIGDAVIAVDSPRGYKIVTIDKSFTYLCPALGTDFLKLDKTN